MTDTIKNWEIGDRLTFKGHPEFYGEDCELEKNDVGIIIDFEDSKVKLSFGEKGIHTVYAFDLSSYQEITSMNPLEKIQWEYSEWVDEYTDLLEKSHVTMNEVQWKYSRLALTWVIRELREIGTEEAKKRIEYLETLYDLK